MFRRGRVSRGDGARRNESGRTDRQNERGEGKTRDLQPSAAEMMLSIGGCKREGGREGERER